MHHECKVPDSPLFFIHIKECTMNTIARLSVALITVVTPFAMAHAGWDSPPDFPIDPASIQSREQVRADAISALAMRRYVQGSFEIAPEASRTAMQVSRARVQAELAEAKRLGLLRESEKTMFATPMQLEQVRAAGVRAG
jgi:hypothetical protein